MLRKRTASKDLMAYSSMKTKMLAAYAEYKATADYTEESESAIRTFYRHSHPDKPVSKKDERAEQAAKREEEEAQRKREAEERLAKKENEKKMKRERQAQRRQREKKRDGEKVERRESSYGLRGSTRKRKEDGIESGDENMLDADE